MALPTSPRTGRPARPLTWAALCAAALAACSADSQPLPAPALPDAGAPHPDAGAAAPDAAPAATDAEPGPDGPACGSAAGVVCEDGQACSFASDCWPGSVCNQPADPAFDPDAPAGVCRRVACSSDAECGAGRTCGLDGTCGVGPCQADGDCGGSQVCRAGACVAPSPLPAGVTCEVVPRARTLAAGERALLEAIVLDADGARVPSPALAWRSSAPAVARVEGADAVAVGTPGAATLTAAVTGGPACAGRVQIVVRAASAGLRVRVVEAGSGAPIGGATVWLVSASGARATTTDAAGEITAPPSGEPLTSVTAEATGRETVSVLDPTERDLSIPLGPAPEPVARGGVRGALDVRTLAAGDIVFALVAAPLPADLSTFRLDALLGDLVDTSLEAPELGLTDMRALLPAGALAKLGTRAFTADDLRCQGLAPAPGEVGCFATRLPSGRTAAWAYARRWRLSELAAVAGDLGQEPGVLADPMGLAVTLLPSMRGGALGITPPLEVVATPRVEAISGRRSPRCDDPSTPAASSDCRSDLAAYAATPLAATAPARLLSIVRTPPLPRGGDGRGAEGVFVTVVASLPEGGWVPLGLDTSAVGADNRVPAAERPFGPLSPPTTLDELPLTSSPPHSGLEGRPRRVAAIAYDRGPRDASGALVPDAGTRFSGVAMPVSRASARITMSAPSFLGYPGGTFSQQRGAYRGDIPAEASLVRLELSHDRARWSVYARPGVTGLSLPPLAALRTALLVGTTPRVSLHVVRGPFTFDEVFRAGSARGLDQLGAHVEAFSAETCGRAEGALCRVQ